MWRMTALAMEPGDFLYSSKQLVASELPMRRLFAVSLSALSLSLAADADADAAADLALLLLLHGEEDEAAEAAAVPGRGTVPRGTTEALLAAWCASWQPAEGRSGGAGAAHSAAPRQSLHAWLQLPRLGAI
jgi:hypothetical protein